MLIALSIVLIMILIVMLLPRGKHYLFGPENFKVGPRHDFIFASGKPYMERWIWYVGLGTIRLHRFHDGDDLRAPHDHPWWFITFPFSTYREKVFRFIGPEKRTVAASVHEVTRFRFHYRPAEYCHMVLPPDDRKPFFTFVISGNKSRSWGFHPFNKDTGKREFVYWRNWK